MTLLRVAYRAFDGFERAFSQQAAAFRELHPDVEFEFVPFDPEALYEALIQDRGLFAGHYDIMLCLTDWLPQVFAIKGFEPLNASLSANPPDDYPQGWSASMFGLQTDEQGQIYALPYHDGPEMFMYRADLFDNPTEQAAFEQQYGYPLRVPETWTQFRDVARFFTRPAQGLYGAIIAGKNDGHNNVYDFLIHLWSRGGRLFDEAWRPCFHEAIGEEALQYYVNLIRVDQVCPPDTLTYDSVASGEAYAAGKGAMMWNWCGFAAVAELPPSKIIGQNRLGLVPRGEQGRHMSLNIYWVLGIAAGSRNKDLAYQFLRHCASAAMDRVTALSGGTGVRLSTWRDASLHQQFNHYPLMEAVHQNVESPPRLPEYPAINAILSDMQWRAVNGHTSVRQALDDAAAAVTSLLRDAGYNA